MRFLFCPPDTSGFVFPAIALALALKERGHEVAFATGLKSRQVLEQVGLPCIPRGPKDGPSFQVEIWAEPLSVAMQYKHLEYALGTFAADVVVGSPLSLGALLVRERLGVPCAVLGLLTHLWPGKDEPLEQPGSAGQARLLWRHGDMLNHFNRARQLFKLPPVTATPGESPLMGDILLQRSVPELARYTGPLPSRVHLVGACLWEPPTRDPELEAWLAQARGSGEPILYVQQGRTFESPSFWPHLMQALRDRPVRLVASVGRMDASHEPMPPGAFVRPLVPQGTVLPHAHAVISSGNSTSALGALTHGLPSLLISGGGEQPDVAELLSHVGAALHLPAQQLSTERVAQSLDTLHELGSLRQQAWRLQQDFARWGGLHRAVELLEQLGKAPTLA